MAALAGWCKADDEGGGDEAPPSAGRCEDEAEGVMCRPLLVRSRFREVDVDAERRRPEEEACDEWVEREEAEVERMGL